MQQLGLRTELASLCLALWAIGGASGRLKCQPEGQPSKLSLPARLALLRCPPDGKQQPDKHQPGYPGWWAQLARLPFWLALWVAGSSSGNPKCQPKGQPSKLSLQSRQAQLALLRFPTANIQQTDTCQPGWQGWRAHFVRLPFWLGLWVAGDSSGHPKCQPKGQPSKLSSPTRPARLAPVRLSLAVEWEPKQCRLGWWTELVR